MKMLVQPPCIGFVVDPPVPLFRQLNKDRLQEARNILLAASARI
jgi:hypothetical protein